MLSGSYHILQFCFSCWGFPCTSLVHIEKTFLGVIMFMNGWDLTLKWGFTWFILLSVAMHIYGSVFKCSCILCNEMPVHFYFCCWYVHFRFKCWWLVITCMVSSKGSWNGLDQKKKKNGSQNCHQVCKISLQNRVFNFVKLGLFRS